MATAAEVLANRALWAVERADAVEWLASLPEGSVDLLFTSPPYERARAYYEFGEDLGIARDTEAWVAWMLTACEAARRACKGLCAFVVEGQTKDYRYTCSPFLLMADLHRRGFHLRKPCVYRRVGIPGSGGPDYLRNDWEPIIVFGRGGRLPWSDNTALGHAPRWAPGGAMSHRLSDGSRVNQWGSAYEGGGPTSSTDGTVRKNTRKPSHKLVTRRNHEGGGKDQSYQVPVLANPGNVIDCRAGGGHLGSDLAHENEAPFPERLAEFFVRSFCPEGGVVADCCAGSGTTLAVARRWGRRAIGCDIRESQVQLTTRRLKEGETMFDALDTTTAAPAAREDARDD